MDVIEIKPNKSLGKYKCSNCNLVVRLYPDDLSHISSDNVWTCPCCDTKNTYNSNKRMGFKGFLCRHIEISMIIATIILILLFILPVCISKHLEKQKASKYEYTFEIYEKKWEIAYTNDSSIIGKSTLPAGFEYHIMHYGKDITKYATAEQEIREVSKNN